MEMNRIRTTPTTNYLRLTPRGKGALAQVVGLAHAAGTANPLLRDDYRQGLRAGMLREAHAAAKAWRVELLRSHDAPANVIARLGDRPVAEWPPQARAQVGLA